MEEAQAAEATLAARRREVEDDDNEEDGEAAEVRAGEPAGNGCRLTANEDDALPDDVGVLGTATANKSTNSSMRKMNFMCILHHKTH